MTLSTTSVSSTSSSRRTTALNPDELDLWELCYYAGLTTDPKVFRILVDLLRMDVHPHAVFEVLKNVTSKSKYNVHAGKQVEKTSPEQPAKKGSASVSATKTSSKTSKPTSKSQLSNKNPSSGEKRTSSSVRSAGSATSKTKSKPASVKSDPGKK